MLFLEGIYLEFFIWEKNVRIQATTRLLLLRHLFVGVLLLAPAFVAYSIYSVPTQTVKAEQHTPAASVISSEEKQVAPVEEVAPEPTPVTTPAPAQPTSPAPAPTPAPAVDRLTIPSLGLNSPFVTVGLASNGAVDVHPSLVGWWNGSASIGTRGAAFLDGHSPGVLSSLANISTGATISVQKANGEAYNYTVVYRETVPLSSVDMRKALSVYGGASEGLNLMTCAGTYIPSMGTTDQRLIVYAVRS